MEQQEDYIQRHIIQTRIYRAHGKSVQHRDWATRGGIADSNPLY